jgi:hypothetical protein
MPAQPSNGFFIHKPSQSTVLEMLSEIQQEMSNVETRPLTVL